MEKNKVINLHEYRQKKIIKNESNLNKINNNKINNFKKEDEDDRRNTFNLFMRVLETIRQESY